MTLPVLNLPENLNYIGVFLTLDCNLNCAYCINGEDLAQDRRPFGRPETTLTPEQWVRGLARIPYRADLPITLQGGEPTVYRGGRGLGAIVGVLPHHFDLLTNLVIKADRFRDSIGGNVDKFQRPAPYPSVRVSYHTAEMERVFGVNAFEQLIMRCESLSKIGLQISPNKAESDVGIYMVAHPENGAIAKLQEQANGRIPLETKTFLGTHEGRLFGDYLYPYSTNLPGSGIWNSTLQCECRTTELLIDALGFIWQCHYHLYKAWARRQPPTIHAQLAARGYRFKDNRPQWGNAQMQGLIGHLLDPAFETSDLATFRPCASYGSCVGCDTKVKNNRFQSLDDANQPHTSVEIRNIEVPQELAQRLQGNAGWHDWQPFLKDGGPTPHG